MGCCSIKHSSDTAMVQPNFLTCLPVEILLHIFSFVGPRDVKNLCLTCKSLQKVMEIESGWLRRCKHDYNACVDLKLDGPSYRSLYTLLLHKYGRLLGLWQTEFEPYGGLLNVHFEGDKLIGTELLAPYDISQPLRSQRLFSICLESTNSIKIECCSRTYVENLHSASIKLLKKSQFEYCCNDIPAHCHPEGNERDLMNWIHEETGASSVVEVADRYDTLLMKYFALMNCNLKYQYRRLSLNTYETKHCPIKPGIFKGTYGSHGTELVLLTYSSTDHATVRKISGDPNIPYKKESFKADLKRPLILSENQQRTFHGLMNARPSYKESLEHLPPQPFLVPQNCIERVSLPTTCQARFQASGQVAGNGYLNPSFTDGHWIIFNEDLFGYLWLELFLLSAFHRVTDLIPSQ